jgi:hypothetical protein
MPAVQSIPQEGLKSLYLQRLERLLESLSTHQSIEQIETKTKVFKKFLKMFDKNPGF